LPTTTEGGGQIWLFEGSGHSGSLHWVVVVNLRRGYLINGVSVTVWWWGLLGNSPGMEGLDKRKEKI
jgi:hypothetical protein